MTISELQSKLPNFADKTLIAGDFTEIANSKNSKFKFSGIYLILDGDQIIYIGSSYVRTVKTRLKQYLGKKDTGNTLAQNLILAKKCNDIDSAVELINKFKIQAFEIHEMEYYLIQNCTDLINQVGN